MGSTTQAKRERRACSPASASSVQKSSPGKASATASRKRRERARSASVTRLRSAFHWLSTRPCDSRNKLRCAATKR